ncbi:MAG: HEAT repeat domain-containing protein [Actinomycetota bacterium]
MVTWFCPECFHEVDELERICPRCGADISEERTYEQRLVNALKHRLADRQLLAAQILSSIGTDAAVEPLAEAARQRRDPYLAGEAIHALASIGTESALRELESIARTGPPRSRRLARQALRDHETAAGTDR